MASVFNISKSGFYSWLKRPVKTRNQDQNRFDLEVKASFEKHNKIYGSVRLTKDLMKKGYGKNRKRVAASMIRQGLRSKISKKFRVVTTDSKHNNPVAPNILDRNFSVENKNQVWISDITYLSTKTGWIYLTVFIDLYSRMIVGWNISNTLQHESVMIALHKALWKRNPQKGLIIHSDRGVQYCCDAFRDFIRKNNYIQSMSRKGNCWDNAVAESFFKTLKTELIYHVNLIDKNHAQHILFDYIEGFYNCKRMHSFLGDFSPMEFEMFKMKKFA